MRAAVADLHRRSCTTIRRRPSSPGRRRSRAVSTQVRRRRRGQPRHPARTSGSGARPRPSNRLAVRRITSRFVLLIATAAVLPLVVYGVVSINSLRSGTERLGPRRQPQRRHAGRPSRSAMYMRHNTRVLQSVGRELGSTGSDAVAAGTHPQGLRPRRSRSSARSPSSTRAGRPLATSALGKTRLDVPEQAPATPDRPYIAPLKRRRRPAADDDHRGAAARDRSKTPAGSSARSRSKSCGGWSTASSVGEQRLRADRQRGRPADRARQPRREARTSPTPIRSRARRGARRSPRTSAAAKTSVEQYARERRSDARARRAAGRRAAVAGDRRAAEGRGDGDGAAARDAS